MKNYLLKFFILFSCIANSQNYIWPLDSPITITGNYGELRANHFHAGLDFTTNGKINLPVYSTMAGYVSRIKISSGGYGKSIYITHPNKKTTVYAHLTSFPKKINDEIIKEQYKQKNYEVDIGFKETLLPVKLRELIGFSGNTGNSTGPHLHFEIRDAQTEIPSNPLLEYNVKDNQKPDLKAIAIYNLADTLMPKVLKSYLVKRNKNNDYKLAPDTIILQNGIVGLGFCGSDAIYKNGNENNVFNAKLELDDKLIYEHNLDGLSFAEQRFVNEFSEVFEKRKYQKCFVPTLFPMNLYLSYKRKGRIILTDTNFHTIKLILSDEAKNETELKFTIKTKKLNLYAEPSIKSDVFVDCRKDFFITKNKLQIYIPANTLYYSTNLIFENTIEKTGKIIILPTEANLKSTSIIGFEIPEKYKLNKDKLVLKSGSSVLPPIVVNDSVFYSVKNFGWFLIDVDTLLPTIKTKLPLAKLKANKNTQTIELLITDNLSGINTYNCYINTNWVLAEYDAKNNLLNCAIPADTPKGKNTFKVEITDRVKNKNLLVFEFFKN